MLLKHRSFRDISNPNYGRHKGKIIISLISSAGKTGFPNEKE
jgi:hypothetical protein